ncbi:MAG: ATP-binding protein [Gammaproteobacteria bacterium]
MDKFHGREKELAQLNRFIDKKTASLVVIRGRRRIGKSRLAQEYGKQFTTYSFSGLPIDNEKKITPQMQREEFARQLQRATGIRDVAADDWGDLFWQLAQYVSHHDSKVLIILDEINWMGSLDPTFLGKLKIAWDDYFKKNTNLVMILSGSMSAWIERNLLSSTGFMGRISLDLILDELPLAICNQFWGAHANTVSAYEKFKILSVIGGVPRYLEEINSTLSAEENIQILGFRKGELLVEEFDRIFTDLFSKRSAVYQHIVESLVSGLKSLEEISQSIKLKKGGQLSYYLEDLVETGYISREYTWKMKSGKLSSLSKFRLKDNYLRFYLKYIAPNKEKIAMEGEIKLPAWHTIMGLQFENLVINNRKSLYFILGIENSEVVVANPYFQKKTNSHEACQIDFLIQTKFNTLYLCEIKFSKEKIGLSIRKDLEEKINRLKAPRNFSIRPVLIHVNGVTDELVESEVFANIIDFSSFL